MATAVAQPTHESGVTAATEAVLLDGLGDQAVSGAPGRDAPAHGFSLELNNDQLEIQRWVHRFAEDVMRPAAQEWDEREETPWPVIEDAAFAGLYSLDFMTHAFGDPSGILMPVVMEEVAWGDAGIGLAIFGTGLAVAGILASGTPEQAAEWLPMCFEGENGKINIAAFGVTEPDAGSDVSSLRSRASYDEAKDEWILNGTKTFITNGGIADVHVLVLSVDPALGARGQASFVVPPGTPGLSMGQKFKKLGIRASHTAEVILDDCRIPGRCVLGGRDRLEERLAIARDGKRARVQPAMATFEASRPAVGAQAVGIARAAYEYALDYAGERRQFGRPILENQAIAFKLADMKMRTDAARLLVWRASWMARTGRAFSVGEGSMAKLYAGENAVWVTDEAIQILGGYGYIRDHPVERWHRDAKIFTIFEGTSEIQRLTIARAISGVRASSSMDGDGTMQRAIEAATTTRVAFERAREVVLDDPGVVFSDARTADQRCPRDFRTELTIDLGSGASVHQEVRLELDDPQLHDAGVVLPVRWRATGRERVLPAFDGALEVTAVRPGTSLRLKGTYTIPMGVVGRFGDAVGGGRVARSSLSALVERLARRLETEVERRRDSAGWHRESNAVTMREQEHPEIYIG